MDEGTQNELKKLLDDYDRKQAADKERTQQLASERAQFESSWQDTIRCTIEPSAQPILDALKARGHHVEMNTDDLGMAFVIRIRPKGMRTAELMFKPDAYDKSVAIIATDIPTKSGGWMGGPRGRAALAQLTKEKIENELMFVVTSVLTVDLNATGPSREAEGTIGEVNAGLRLQPIAPRQAGGDSR